MTSSSDDDRYELTTVDLFLEYNDYEESLMHSSTPSRSIVLWIPNKPTGYYGGLCGLAIGGTVARPMVSQDLVFQPESLPSQNMYVHELATGFSSI